MIFIITDTVLAIIIIYPNYYADFISHKVLFSHVHQCFEIAHKKIIIYLQPRACLENYRGCVKS